MRPHDARSTRALGVLALLAPAIAPGLAVLLRGPGPGGVPARDVAVVALAALCALVAWTPRWRATLERIASVLLERLRPPAWALLALAFGLLASGPCAPALLGLAVGCALLFVAGTLEERRRDPHALLRRLALLAIWALSFAALELVVGRYVLPRRSHNKILTVHDPVLGWRLRPDFEIVHHDPEYASRETINSLGFRTPERPFERPAGVKRLVILGDSHSEGYTVDDDRTVARLLDRDLGPAVEVICLGVGGYSTDQELLSYLEVGRRFHPDVVLLQVCENDVPFNVLENYWRGSKPYFVRYGELLELRGVPVPDVKSSGLVPDLLVRHSAFFTFLEGQLRALAIRHAVEDEADTEEGWRVTELLVRDLRRAVASDGARLLAYDVNVDQVEFDQRLRALLGRQGVPCLDISPAYATDFDSLWVSGHWNAEGQRRVEAALLPALRAALDETSR